MATGNFGATTGTGGPVSEEEEEPAFTFLALKSAALACLVIWTIIANALVFVVLYKNPRLQTVPNFLVANLAFSDLCLGLVVLPLSAVYAVTLHWSFGKIVCEIWLSSDVLCSTASIWNLSIIGLDRYWAITSPITYITKRNMRSALIMIAGVWALSMLISVAPFFGWRNSSEKGNYVYDNNTDTYQCQFLDLPAYTIYSATGSFYIPLTVMFFVYFQIYRAFAEHKARQIYRQKVIKKHIESTILHEISHVLPTSDEFAKEDEDDDDEDEDDEDDDVDEDSDDSEEDEDDEQGKGRNGAGQKEHALLSNSYSVPSQGGRGGDGEGGRGGGAGGGGRGGGAGGGGRGGGGAGERGGREGGGSSSKGNNQERLPLRRGNQAQRTSSQPGKHSTGRHQNKKVPPVTSKPLTYERVKRHKQRKERRAMMRQSLQKKPPAISAAKEKRGVKVLGIILGCFAICWTPFFIMYLVTGFCQSCRPNPHIEQFITWLGYSNSAMNPIIYTVFNRDYQNALKRLFVGSEKDKRKAGRLSKL